MKHFNFLLVIMSFWIYSYSENVDTSTARIVGKNFYYEKINMNDKIEYDSIALTLVFTEENINIPLYYIFDINNRKGFIIVSADDNTIPVLGYSFESNYNIDTLKPLQFILFIDNYKQQIIEIKKSKIAKTKIIEDLWNKYLENPYISEVKGGKDVTPLLTTRWDQIQYYNSKCPVDAGGSGGHAPVGCTPTAMAQVMKYWNHPTKGKGTFSYNCSPYGILSADFGNTTYQWSDMPNSLGYSSTTQQKDAVATLLYHCGVAMQTTYTTDYSSTIFQMIPYSLKQYFYYSTNVVIREKVDYADTAWNNLLINELNEGRPVIYCGSGPSGGHTFVCDGYQSSSYFHMNWGWGSYYVNYDGYYYLNDLTPGSYNFNNNQYAVIGIEPVYSSDIQENDDFENTIEIYPNPSNGQFNLAIKEKTDNDITIEIYNIQGKIIYRNNHTERLFDNPIDVSVSKGIYFLKATIGENIHRGKIIIQ